MNKTCSVCGDLLPNTREYFVYSKRDGLASKCKICRNKERRERYENDAKYCETEKSRVREWNKSHPETTKLMSKRYYSAHKEEAIERTRQWREDNPERYKEQNAGRWDRYKNDPEIVMAYRAATNNYRAKKRNNGGTATAEEIQERIEEQGYMCFYCSHPLEDDYHIDHFVPVSRGGGSEIENLVASCPSCNLSKGDKDPHEFMSQIGRAFVYN
jgi:5-methylcytosine-specific restriction endonuclease McrA